MTCFYIIVNRPGFLPDGMGEGVGCESLDDARDALASEICRTAEQCHGDSDPVESAIEEAEALAAAESLMPGESVLFAGLAHSITESDEAF